MTWKQIFTSSIGQKFVMALSGLFLITFLIVHVGLNACIWANDNGEMFNKAAHFMGSTVVIRIIEWGLFAGFILHIIQGYLLASKNRSTRKVGYAVKLGERGSRWYSRSMGLLGTLILLFLVLHISNFWWSSRVSHDLPPVSYDGKEMHNLYARMLETFHDPVMVVIYVLGCISLAYHLLHGFQSAFRTLGMHRMKYVKMVRFVGAAFAIVVSAAFAMMPVSMYLGWIK